MKKIVLVLMAAFLMGGMAMAQERGEGRRGGDRKMDPKEMAQRMTDRMAKEYSLNEDQKKQLLEINQQMMEKMGQGRPGPGMRPGGKDGQRPELTDEQKAEMEKKRAEMEAAQKEYNEKLQTILTKEQFEDYQKKQQDRGRRGGPRGDRGPRGNR